MTWTVLGFWVLTLCVVMVCHALVEKAMARGKR